MKLHDKHHSLISNDPILLLDSDEYRDYHDQFGVCNAPDTIELLRNEVRNALEQIQN
jgi:hypothetical protein